MTEHLVPLQFPVPVFLQLFTVAAEPVFFDVLQPARTFSSGVPLPRTINWGCIHFSRLSSIFHLIGRLLCQSCVFQRETYDVLEMTLHFLVAVVQLKTLLLQQPVFVADMPVLFDVLQPARTFSSGVPLPRTINWGCIHFSRLSSMFPPLRSWHPFHKDALYLSS